MRFRLGVGRKMGVQSMSIQEEPLGKIGSVPSLGSYYHLAHFFGLLPFP